MPPLLSEPVGTKISKKFTIQIFLFIFFFLNNNMVMSQNNNKTGEKKITYSKRNALFGIPWSDERADSGSCR